MFHGRQRELVEIGERLARGSRLVTVIGAGGIGKTTLVQRIALDRKSVMVDLSAARTEGEAIATLARALDIQLTPRGDPIDQLAEALASRQTLLVLDNCEQLIEPLAAIVPRLWRAAPVIATSRERLRLSGEDVFELQPLEHRDALSLFLEKARRVRAGSEASPVIEEIVESLDRIPLALELAASRMGVLDATALRDRLQRGIDVLEGRSRDRSDRQRTMRATIDWSWSMLSADERRALARLAVFRGGFDVDAAEAVIGGSALALIESLRDRSLLRTSAEGPLLGLYEPIRAYALEKLRAAGEEEEARRRHAAHFADRARSGRATEADAENLAAVIERRDNFEDSAAAALVRHDAVLLRGPLRPWLETLDELLSRDTSPALLIARSRARQLLGMVTEARQDAEAARAGDASIRARAAWQLGSIAGQSGEHVEARARYQEALTLLPPNKSRFDRETEAMALGNLGTVLREDAELLAARERYEQALSVAREAGLPRLVGQYLGDLGALFHMAGDLDRSSRTFEQAIEALTEAGDQRMRGLFIGARALVVQERGDLDGARALIEQAIAVQRAVGDRRYHGYLIGCRAQVDHEAGLLDDAERGYRDAIAELREVKNTRVEGLFIAALGALLARTKRRTEAIASFARAEELLRSVGDHVRLAAVLVHKGHLLRERDAIHACLTEGREHAAHSDDVRFAVRILEREVADTSEALHVARDGSSFRPPRGAPVDLAKKASAKRLLAALAEARERSPGSALSTHELFAAGWPGERARDDSAANRVYVALASLRTLGLRGILESSDAGYRLDPRVPLAR